MDLTNNKWIYPKCKTCRFWVKFNGDDGTCKRHLSDTAFFFIMPEEMRNKVELVTKAYFSCNEGCVRDEGQGARGEGRGTGDERRGRGSFYG